MNKYFLRDFNVTDWISTVSHLAIVKKCLLWLNNKRGLGAGTMRMPMKKDLAKKCSVIWQKNFNSGSFAVQSNVIWQCT